MYKCVHTGWVLGMKPRVSALSYITAWVPEHLSTRASILPSSKAEGRASGRVTTHVRCVRCVWETAKVP